MNDHRERTPFFLKKAYRLVSGFFGIFLIGVGFYVLLFAGSLTVLHLIAGLALILLGSNMVVAAYSSKESWLSKIGPLP